MSAEVAALRRFLRAQPDSVVPSSTGSTARHAGHLDVVRELIDGRVGLGPR